MRFLDKPLDNVVDSIRQAGELDHDIFEHFRKYSKLFRAIEKHITYDENQVLIDYNKYEHTIFLHRGNGAVSFKEAYLPFEKEYFVMKINVSFCGTDDPHDSPDTYTEEFYLNIPIVLELEFSQRKFNNWIKKLRKEKDKEIKEIDMREYKRLKKKYGEIE